MNLDCETHAEIDVTIPNEWNRAAQFSRTAWLQYQQNLWVSVPSLSCIPILPGRLFLPSLTLSSNTILLGEFQDPVTKLVAGGAASVLVYQYRSCRSKEPYRKIWRCRSDRNWMWDLRKSLRHASICMPLVSFPVPHSWRRRLYCAVMLYESSCRSVFF